MSLSSSLPSRSQSTGELMPPISLITSTTVRFSAAVPPASKCRNCPGRADVTKPAIRFISTDDPPPFQIVKVGDGPGPRQVCAHGIEKVEHLLLVPVVLFQSVEDFLIVGVPGGICEPACGRNLFLILERRLNRRALLRLLVTLEFLPVVRKPRIRRGAPTGPSIKTLIFALI